MLLVLQISLVKSSLNLSYDIKGHFSYTWSTNMMSINFLQLFFITCECWIFVNVNQNFIIFITLIQQGGEPDVNTVAKMVLNDFQRGKLPHFVKPPVRNE